MSIRLAVLLLLGVVLVTTAIVIVTTIGGATVVAAPTTHPARHSPLQFTVKDIDGQDFDLSTLRGQVVMIVNTASRCGLTPQYRQLQALYDRFKDRGLVIVGFPANNFGGQEPGSNEQIEEFCRANYGVSFPLMGKISAKGADIHPLYAFLTSGETGGAFAGEIGWNFTKFVIDRNGAVIARFAPRVSPDQPQVIEVIEKALQARASD